MLRNQTEQHFLKNKANKQNNEQTMICEDVHLSER